MEENDELFWNELMMWNPYHVVTVSEVEQW